MFSLCVCVRGMWSTDSHFRQHQWWWWWWWFLFDFLAFFPLMSIYSGSHLWHHFFVLFCIQNIQNRLPVYFTINNKTELAKEAMQAILGLKNWTTEYASNNNNDEQWQWKSHMYNYLVSKKEKKNDEKSNQIRKNWFSWIHKCQEFINWKKWNSPGFFVFFLFALLNTKPFILVFSSEKI
mgnify:CR=1 FL=1